ncbi:pilus assembly protein [Thermodesulfobacteriota bacterium]
MKRAKKYLTTGLTVILSLVMAFFPTAAALAAAVCNQDPDVPAFLSAGVDPNLLLVIDNSASMYDPAYVDITNQCYDDTYDPNTQYAGYFNIGERYIYDFTNGRFVGHNNSTTTPSYSTLFTAYMVAPLADELRYWKDYTNDTTWEYGVKVNTATPAVIGFVATGSFLNWAAASKFDIEKEILTGGKYDSTLDVMIMESRGCMERRQVKQALFNQSWDGSTFVDPLAGEYSLTLGVRSPDATEQAADVIATGSSNTTRIEIFNVVDGGFDYDACASAVDELDPPEDTRLGTLKGYVKDCMGYVGGVSDEFKESYAAFNHALQECWYYGKKGYFQPGAGTVSSMENACEDIYDDRAPETITTDNKAYVCYGVFTDSPPSGYVGRCYDPGGGGGPCEAFPCTPAKGVDPGNPDPTHCIDIPAGDPDLELSDGTEIDPGLYEYNCFPTSKYNEGDDDCFGNGVWTLRVENCPAGAAPAWNDTDVAPADGIHDCTDQAIKDYCGILDIPEVIDPSDAQSATGEVWNVPAVLVDSGVISQLNEPLVSMKGHIAQPSAPSGLIQEFAMEIRMGVMTFNDNGAKTECEALTPTTIPDSEFPYMYYICDPDSPEVNAGTPCCDDPLVNPETDCDQLAMEEQINFNCLAGNRDGGKILAYIDQSPSHTDAVVAAINGLVGSTWTPLAEALFNAIGYYTQRTDMRLDPLDFTTHAEDNNIKDPCDEWCYDNNILLITDGSSTADTRGDIKTVVGDVDAATDITPDIDDCDVLHGTTYLDDLTYYAKKGTNIFAEEPFLDWDAVNSEWVHYKNNIKTHIVVAGTPRNTGADECSPHVLLPNAANAQDDATYDMPLYTADNPSELDDKLREAFNAIRAGAASGSAASVISASRGGEGAIYQAIFWPTTDVADSAGGDVVWTGEVHALLIDAYGNMYEDTQPSPGVKGNRTLGAEDERVILYFDENVEPPISRACYPTDDSDPFDTDGSCKGIVKDLREIAYLWSAAEWLAGITDINENRSVADYISDDKQRYIFTWNDLNNDGIVTNDEVLPFVPSTASNGTNWDAMLTPAAGAALTDDLNNNSVEDPGESRDRAPVPYDFNVTNSADVDKIVKWVRGDNTVADRRSRAVPYDFNLSGALDGTEGSAIWRLGDVIHSTPTSVARPSEGYHFLYKDGSYGEFLDTYKKRRHVVYFGGNDGMFHAVNAGFYHEENKKFCRDLHDVTGECLDDDPTPSYSPELGAELWAYVPYNLLPHLNCMTLEGYQHKYYVDQRARVFDVRIWDDTGDTTHVRGWGTILVGGMRFGGTKVLPSEMDLVNPNDGPEYPADTREFTSAYFIMDITDPEEPPVLLGEFTRTTHGTEVELGYTSVIPTLVVMKNDVDTDYDTWYLILGSGPTAMDGTSNQTPKVAVIPLKDLKDKGRSFRIPDEDTAVTDWGTFDLTGSDLGFVSDMITVDLELDSLYKSDAVYFGTVEGDWSGWGGQLYRLVTRLEAGAPPSGPQEVTVPSQWGALAGGTNPKPLIDVGQPITAAPNVARDVEGNFWVYFGTGRFFTPDDKTDTQSNAQQTYYGIKEPRDCDRNVNNDDGVTWETVENVDTVFDGGGETWNTVPGEQGLQRVDQIQVLAAGNSVTSTLSCADIDLPINGSPDANCQALIDFGVDNFNDLDNFISGTGKCYDEYDETHPAGGPYTRAGYSTGTDGWYKHFHDERERNLGQATLLGGLLTFTSYQPYEDVCLSEGLAALYGVYYRTGTGYFIPTFGDTAVVGGNVTEKISLGRGMATTPNLHVGKQEGSKAFVQTSTGTIVEIPQPNLPIGTFKTGRQSWIEMKP